MITQQVQQAIEHAAQKANLALTNITAEKDGANLKMRARFVAESGLSFQITRTVRSGPVERRERLRGPKHQAIDLVKTLQREINRLANHKAPQ